MTLVRWLASIGGQHQVLDGVAAVLVNNSLFRGVPTVAILAGYWSAQLEPEQRSLHFRRVALAGFMAAGAALLASRVLQNVWSTPRPIYHPALTGLFRAGATIDVDYNSFPSDHAAGLFPLVWTVYRLQPWLGAVTALLLTATLSARAYQGLHFPVDLVGGLAIGALAMMAFGRPGAGTVKDVLRLIQAAQTRWPWLTAAGLFVVAYGYATLFTEFRSFLVSVAKALARL